MNRTDARAQIAATLDALDLFAVVMHGTPDSFEGQSPVAVISSTSMLGGLLTRGVLEVASGMTISIYVLRPAGSEGATEDALDALTLAVIAALLTGGDMVPHQSDASPGGAPSRIIDGLVYRVERIPVTLANNLEE